MKFNNFLLQSKEYPLAALQKKAAALRDAGHDIINLTVGDPKDPTYDHVNQEIKRFLSDNQYSQYPKPAGSPELLASISTWANRNYDIELDSNTQICSCNGTKEAIFLAPLLFDWSNNKEIYFSALSYPVYKASAQQLTIPFRELSVSKQTNFLPNLDSLTEDDWQKCGVFWLNSPHNPTTTIAPRDYFETLLNYAEKYQFFVFSDECYNDLYEGETPVSCLDFPKSDRWVVFRSLSKRSHMTGFRSGAIMSKNTQFMTLLKKSRSPIGLGTPTSIQQGAIAAWDDDSHVQVHNESYKWKRQRLKKILLEKGFELYGADAGFYFWFSHPKYSTSEQLSELFLKNGLLITPGTVFGQDGEGYARMVFCITDDMIRVVEEKLTNLEL